MKHKREEIRVREGLGFLYGFISDVVQREKIGRESFNIIRIQQPRGEYSTVIFAKKDTIGYDNMGSINTIIL